MGNRMSSAELLGGLLYDAREEAGCSMTELASAAGIDQAHISRMERGIKFPSKATLGKMLDYLDVDPDDRRYAVSLCHAFLVERWEAGGGSGGKHG